MVGNPSIKSDMFGGYRGKQAPVHGKKKFQNKCKLSHLLGLTRRDSRCRYSLFFVLVTVPRSVQSYYFFKVPIVVSVVFNDIR